MIGTEQFGALLHMAEELLDLKGLGLEPDKVVFAGPDHPVWTSIDDDDWNGATCGQWLQGLAGKVVYLLPPEGAPLERVLEAVRRNAAEAQVVDARGSLKRTPCRIVNGPHCGTQGFLIGHRREDGAALVEYSGPGRDRIIITPPEWVHTRS